jgi:hypothetical protein
MCSGQWNLSMRHRLLETTALVRRAVRAVAGFEDLFQCSALGATFNIWGTRMKSVLGGFAVAASLHAFTLSAHATAITLDFDGLDGAHTEKVLDFYNGGRGSRNSGPGPDYGITISPLSAQQITDPFVICKDGGFCNDRAAGNALFIFGNLQAHDILGPGAIIHVSGGFRGIVEFDASANRTAGVVVRGEHGADRIGSITPTGDPDECGRLQCPFQHFSFALDDPGFTESHDLVFSTLGDDALIIDNLTFRDIRVPDDDTPPVAVSEPSSVLLGAGIGVIGAALRRRRRAPA